MHRVNKGACSGSQMYETDVEGVYLLFLCHTSYEAKGKSGGAVEFEHRGERGA